MTQIKQCFQNYNKNYRLGFHFENLFCQYTSIEKEIYSIYFVKNILFLFNKLQRKKKISSKTLCRIVTNANLYIFKPLTTELEISEIEMFESDEKTLRNKFDIYCELTLNMKKVCLYVISYFKQLDIKMKTKFFRSSYYLLHACVGFGKFCLGEEYEDINVLTIERNRIAFWTLKRIRNSNKFDKLQKSLISLEQVIENWKPEIKNEKYQNMKQHQEKLTKSIQSKIIIKSSSSESLEKSKNSKVKKTSIEMESEQSTQSISSSSSSSKSLKSQKSKTSTKQLENNDNENKQSQIISEQIESKKSSQPLVSKHQSNKQDKSNMSEISTYSIQSKKYPKELVTKYRKLKEILEQIEEKSNSKIKRLIEMYNELIDEAEKELKEQREQFECEMEDKKHELETVIETNNIMFAKEQKELEESIFQLKKEKQEFMIQLEIERMQKCENEMRKYMREKNMINMDYSIDVSKRFERIELKHSEFKSCSGEIEIELPFISESYLIDINNTLKISMKKYTINVDQFYETNVPGEYKYQEKLSGSILVENALDRYIYFVKELRCEKELKEQQKQTSSKEEQDKKMKEFESLQKELDERKQYITQLEQEMNILKEEREQLKQNNSNNQKEIEQQYVSISVPIVNYYTCQSVKFEHNNFNIEVPISGDTIENNHISYPKCGINSNGEQCDLIVVVSMDTQNGMYQRQGNDIIQILQFERQFEGQQTALDLQLPDGSSSGEQIFTIKENEKVVLEGKGLTSSDGTHGNFIFLIQLN